MKNAKVLIGMDADPIEELDLKIQVAIAAAAKAKFQAQGDEQLARAEVHRLIDQRSLLETKALTASG